MSTWCQRATHFHSPQILCWHKTWKQHQNILPFLPCCIQQDHLITLLDWTGSTSWAACRAAGWGSYTCTAASRQQEKAGPRPQLCCWEWLPTQKTSGKHHFSSSLVLLLLTPSTPSNHYDIWVPLCVSFLWSNHLNPSLKQSRPCWGTHNRCLSLAGQSWPQWHL